MEQDRRQDKGKSMFDNHIYNVNGYQTKARNTAVYPHAGKQDTNAKLYTVIGLVDEACEVMEKISAILDRQASPSPALAQVQLRMKTMVSEGKELGKLKKSIRKGELQIEDLPAMTEEENTAVEAELGDVSWYLAGTASECGRRMSGVLGGNLYKLARRKFANTIEGNGDNR